MAAGLALVSLAAAVGVDALGPEPGSDPARRLQPWYVRKATLEEVLELLAAVLALDTLLGAAKPRAAAAGSLACALARPVRAR